MTILESVQHATMPPSLASEITAFEATSAKLKADLSEADTDLKHFVARLDAAIARMDAEQAVRPGRAVL